MLNKKKKYILVCFIVILLSGWIVQQQFTIIMPQSNKIECQKKFGIIDGNLSYDHDNIFNTNSTIDAQNKTHGDKILEFLSLYSPHCQFFYCDVEKDKKISTQHILGGLEWMLSNNVDYVSISLSGKYDSKELQSWLEEHSHEITVYASYNNYINTLDYPAGYKTVIGVGASSKIKKKEKDIIFLNNNVVLLSSYGIYYYVGNSILTPYTMIRENYK